MWPQVRARLPVYCDDLHAQVTAAIVVPGAVGIRALAGAGSRLFTKDALSLFGG